MSTEDNSNWKKSFVETIDQRSLELPPAWVPTGARKESHKERGHDIYESGRDRSLADAVVALLTQARDKSVVSSFLLADRAVEDAILDAATRGVRVYVLLASEARLGIEDKEGEFDKRVLEQHKAMLTRLGGHVLFKSAPHFHAKVVVIDPDTNPAGILLTANLTTEALERNEELGVTLNADEVIEVINYLKWAMWESAEHELLDPKDRFKATSPLGKIPHPTGATAIVATTAETNLIREEMLRLIEGARSQIVVSSFGWDEDHEVIRRLCVRAQEGITVTVLARTRPSSMAALLMLAKAGASVFAFKWLHAKAIWTDARQALVMSANLQKDGLDKGFELGVRLADERAQEVNKILRAWKESAPWRLLPQPRLDSILGPAMLWHNSQLIDAEIKASIEVNLGTSTAASADELEAPRPPLPKSEHLPKLAHELHCSWQVTAPVLIPKSKEQKRPTKDKEQPRPYSPPVFREPNGRVVVAIKSPLELTHARAVMTEIGASAIVITEGSIR